MKAILLLSTVCIVAYARPDVDQLTICYGVKNNKVAFKTPCIVTNTGGAGVSILEYQFKDRKYMIENSDSGNFLNDKKYVGYMRDSFFNVTNIEKEKKFFCYENKRQKNQFLFSTSYRRRRI